MKKLTLLIVGILIGVVLPYMVDMALFGDPTPLQPTKIYEDGSYYGCLPKGLCND